MVDANLSNRGKMPRFYDFGSNSGNSIFCRINGNFYYGAGEKYAGGSTLMVEATANAIALNTTTTIVVTFDAATHTTTIYADGKKVAQGTKITYEPWQAAPAGEDSRNYIGRTQWWDNNSDNGDVCGTIDNFRLYNIALTAEELSEIASDINTVPEGIDMTATGLYVLGGRYTPDIMFDDIEVSVDKTAANTPTVTLTGINNVQRVYTIKFQEDEILHLDFNGKTTDVNYADVDNGTYTWSNNPSYDPSNTSTPVTSGCDAGTLKAWTTLDNMKSDVVETEVDNNIIALPAATAEVSNVSVGYGKTYSVTCDNSNTPLSPAIYGTYKFTGKDGKVTESAEPKAFPFNVDVDQAGTLEITSQAFGYGSTNTTVENDVEYEVKKTIDLAHMTEKDITAAGFEKGDNVNNNYSNYGRF